METALAKRKTDDQPRRRDAGPAFAGDPARRGYERTRDLPGLLPLWPSEAADASEEGRLRVLAKLKSALRAERARGAAGHWTYDLTRHAQLAAAYAAEREALRNVAQPSR